MLNIENAIALHVRFYLLFIDRNHTNSAFHSLPDQGVLAGADRHHQLNLGDLWIEKGNYR